MRRFNSEGGSHIVLAAVILVVLGVGFAAYKVVGKQPAQPATQQTSNTSSGKYKTTADVKKANTELDSTDVDKSLDSSQLDTDLNDLL